MRTIILTIAAASSISALSPSAAMAGTIATAEAVRVAPDRVTLRWTDKAPVDVFQSARPDAAPADAMLISAKDGDGTHDVTVAPNVRPYFLLRDTRSGAVTRIAERAVQLEQGSNFRDIGGYAGAGGKHVRWGRIYRSGAQPLLTDADVRELRGLGIANLVDLRSNEERILAPTRLDGIPYNAVGYSRAPSSSAPAEAPDPNRPFQRAENLYRTMPESLSAQLRLVFRKLLSKKGPLAFNCTAGQDRTGLAAALILSALGVSRETIYADYGLSYIYRRPQWEMAPISDAVAASNPVFAALARNQRDPRMSKAHPLQTTDGTPFLSFAFDAIDARWGSVDAYLEQELGLTKLDLAALRAEYLE